MELSPHTKTRFKARYTEATMPERAERPKSPDEIAKSLSRQLPKIFHPDGKFKEDPEAVKQASDKIMMVLANCIDANKTTEERRDSRGRITTRGWTATWDNWRPDSAAAINDFIELVREHTDATGGRTVEHSPRAIRPSSYSPREFLNLLKTYIDKGQLPVESDRDRRDRETWERLKEDALREKAEKSFRDKDTSDPFKTGRGYSSGAGGGRGAGGAGGSGESAEEKQRREQEEAAREQARREQEQRDFEEEMRRQESYRERWQRWRQEQAQAKEKADREAAEKAEAARKAAEEAARQAKEEADRRAEEQRKREEAEAARRAQEAKERAEREARKPENVFARRMRGATTFEHFKSILKDIEEAYANRVEGDNDKWFPDAAYNEIRFGQLPQRAAEFYKTQLENSKTARSIRSVFRNVITEGFFKDMRQPFGPPEVDTLSPLGESLLADSYVQAASYFKDKIEKAEHRSELGELEKELQQFYGGALNEVNIFRPSLFGVRPALTTAERASMTREQAKRYEKGETEPIFTGPFSAEEREKMMVDAKVSYKGPSGRVAADTIRGLVDQLEKKKEDLWRSKLPKAPRDRSGRAA